MVIPTAGPPAAPPQNGQYHHLNPGETIKTQPYAVVSGDVRINGQFMADNGADSHLTGHVFILAEAATIEALYGADVTDLLDQASAETLALQQQRIMERAGCEDGHGCSGGVEIQRWP